ncbi:hypothetical protein VNO77_08136 [Canavalia gladiata]|uniref:Uncharacterized protein n=1 Tax=Canavalia gladiata TaxID=3824 RepID=A0AAN9QWH0_CANGL
MALDFSHKASLRVSLSYRIYQKHKTPSLVPSGLLIRTHLEKVQGLLCMASNGNDGRHVLLKVLPRSIVTSHGPFISLWMSVAKVYMAGTAHQGLSLQPRLNTVCVQLAQLSTVSVIHAFTI